MQGIAGAWVGMMAALFVGYLWLAGPLAMYGAWLGCKRRHMDENPIEEIKRLAFYLQGYGSASDDKKMERAAEWLHRLANRSCVGGIIGCSGGLDMSNEQDSYYGVLIDITWISENMEQWRVNRPQISEVTIRFGNQVVDMTLAEFCKRVGIEWPK
jgi:hypothetical protein